MEALFDLDPTLVTLLSDESKDEAIVTLGRMISDSIPSVDQERLITAVRLREAQISSRVASGIAVPHAVLLEVDGSHIALGLSVEGIVWDAGEESRVHLVVLLASSEEQHLQQLACGGSTARKG